MLKNKTTNSIVAENYIVLIIYIIIYIIPLQSENVVSPINSFTDHLISCIVNTEYVHAQKMSIQGVYEVITYSSGIEGITDSLISLTDPHQ